MTSVFKVTPKNILGLEAQKFKSQLLALALVPKPRLPPVPAPVESPEIINHDCPIARNSEVSLMLITMLGSLSVGFESEIYSRRSLDLML